MATLPEVLGVQTTVYYGFAERCEENKFSDNGPRVSGCRPFPTKDSDACDQTYRSFCTLWSTASYVSYLAIGFGIITCAAIVFGVSTHSRRKRIWKVVAALIALHGARKSLGIRGPTPLIWDLNALGISQLATFALVTDLYRLRNFPLSPIAHSHLGMSSHLLTS